MTIRVPAREDVQCEKCGAENIGRKVYVWLVSDERGAGYECDVCAGRWQTERQKA